MSASKEIRQILRGMDATWHDASHGWWQRRADARFGAERMSQAFALVERLEAELARVQPAFQRLPADDTEGGEA